MTHKDFELIAKIIRDTVCSDSLRAHIAHTFAQNLADKFPRFDYERFITARLKEEN